MHLRPLGHLSWASRPRGTRPASGQAEDATHDALLSQPAGCGERGIRTLGTLTGTPDFESGTFGHSVISPRRNMNGGGHPVNEHKNSLRGPPALRSRTILRDSFRVRRALAFRTLVGFSLPAVVALGQGSTPAPSSPPAPTPPATAAPPAAAPPAPPSSAAP